MCLGHRDRSDPDASQGAWPSCDTRSVLGGLRRTGGDVCVCVFGGEGGGGTSQ